MPQPPNPSDNEELCQIFREFLVIPPPARSESAFNAVSSSELESKLSTIKIQDEEEPFSSKRERSISTELMLCPPGDARTKKHKEICSTQVLHNKSMSSSSIGTFLSDGVSLTLSIGNHLPTLSISDSAQTLSISDRKPTLSSNERQSSSDNLLTNSNISRSNSSRREKESVRVLNNELKVVMTECSLAPEVKVAIAMLLHRGNESKPIVRDLWNLISKYEVVLDELLQHRQQQLDKLRRYSPLPSFPGDCQMLGLVYAKQQTFLLGAFRRDVFTLSFKFLVVKKGKKTKPIIHSSRSLAKLPTPLTTPPTLMLLTMADLGPPNRDSTYDRETEKILSVEDTTSYGTTSTSTGASDASSSSSSLVRAKPNRVRDRGDAFPQLRSMQ